jgi:glutaminyl-peptide cyclotransferase
LAVLPCVALVACGTANGGDAPPAATMKAQVLEVLPHDPTAFTQGLELSGDVLYEGTGLAGQSEVRVGNPKTGAVSRRTGVPSPMFGEGVTVAGSKLWQLTWQDGVAIQRDRETLAELRRVTYEGEGWGLCLDGRRLVMSDGSDRLTFRDPETFQPTGEVLVSAAGKPVTRLNELECTPSGVYANVWQTDSVVRIDPASGQVTATIDLSGLLTPEERARTDVLNGIAAVPGTDEFLVTGKLWPKMFRVRFVT